MPYCSIQTISLLFHEKSHRRCFGTTNVDKLAIPTIPEIKTNQPLVITYHFISFQFISSCPVLSPNSHGSVFYERLGMLSYHMFRTVTAP